MKDKEVVVYQAESGAIQLRPDMSAETIWATQRQIADIFGVKTAAINNTLKTYLKKAN